MERITDIDDDIADDVATACAHYERVLPDSVGYRVFEYYSLESSEPILFVSFCDEIGIPDRDLAEFLNNCDDVPDHIQTETRAGGGEPVILCENVGDCAEGFEWLLENYGPWQRYKLSHRLAHALSESKAKDKKDAL